VITPQGATIRGGPHDRLEIAWSAIQQIRIETPPKPQKGSSEPDDSDLRILVMRAHGKELHLASAERPAEQQSLRELEATLVAASSPPADLAKERAPADRVDQLACAECGAALVPVDAAETKCLYCDHVTPVADRIRQQVRDTAALASRPDAQIAKLLDQPRAGSVGAMYLVAALFMLVAWPLAVFMMVFEWSARTLTPARGGFLVGFVLACIAGFYALIRTRLVDRHALRLVAVDFAALEPARPGEPYRCQRCVAPLPDAPRERSVVRCIYCATDNVLGLVIGRRASAAPQESASLADALANRTRERRQWRGVSVVALGLLVTTTFTSRSSHIQCPTP
jgi:hypothetical protein